jgi:retron-type reverse transcriptase
MKNWIQQHIRKIIHNDQFGLIPGMQVWSNMCKSIIVVEDFNRIKEKNHSIISNYSEKVFDKIQHHFFIKALRKLGMYLNIVKVI